MNYFEAIKTILGFIPLLVQAMQAVEAAIPQQGAGAHKLQAVGEILSASYTAATGAVDGFSKIWPTLQTIAGTFTALFNKTGIFSTGNGAPQA